MEALPLRGRVVLVVEDEPLIALDLEQCLRDAGAEVVSACTLVDGLRLAEWPGLSAAVVDYALGAGDCLPICQRLRARGIPFVIYSGYADIGDQFPDAVIVAKPAALGGIADAVSAVLPAIPVIERIAAVDHARQV